MLRKVLFNSHFYSDINRNSLYFPGRWLYPLLSGFAVRLLYSDLIGEDQLGVLSGYWCSLIANVASISKAPTTARFFGNYVPIFKAGADVAVSPMKFSVSPLSFLPLISCQIMGNSNLLMFHEFILFLCLAANLVITRLDTHVFENELPSFYCSSVHRRSFSNAVVRYNVEFVSVKDATLVLAFQFS